jgi:hypothetical protein
MIAPNLDFPTLYEMMYADRDGSYRRGIVSDGLMLSVGYLVLISFGLVAAVLSLEVVAHASLELKILTDDTRAAAKISRLLQVGANRSGGTTALKSDPR